MSGAMKKNKTGKCIRKCVTEFREVLFEKMTCEQRPEQGKGGSKLGKD